jgi:hypothetical protein
MKKHPHTVPPLVIYFFMVVGLFSAVAFRLLTIVGAFRPELVRPLWYVGVIGYILFFAYRYYITEKRKKAIRANLLLEKIRGHKEIDDGDRELIAYVLASIVKSKEHINYLFIFLLSILAIGADILLAWHG